jgi:hypothetical protein
MKAKPALLGGIAEQLSQRPIGDRKEAARTIYSNQK